MVFTCFYAQLDKVTTFALDKIIIFTETDQDYIPNTVWDFEDIIGVTILEDAQPGLVKLAFSSESAPYILSKQLHGSLKNVSQDENRLTVTIGSNSQL